MLPPIRQGMTALHSNELCVSREAHAARQSSCFTEKNVQDGELAPQVCEAIESAYVPWYPRHHKFWPPYRLLRVYAPLVDAAWCLTAARSRLNSLSTIHEGLASALLKRRWAVARACCEARCEKRARLRVNMVGAGVGTLAGGRERFRALVVR